MSRPRIAFFGCVLVPLALATVTLAQAPRQPTSGPLPAPSVPSLAQGEQVFAQTCSNQYCHGPGGRGAQGPRLVDVPMSPETLRATISEGRVGTAMVSFRNVLEPDQLEAVTAYTLSISSGGRLTLAPLAPGAAPPSSDPSPLPVSIGKEQGTPARGAELFFDATRLASCRTCHSFKRRGGPLGMDFADARKTAPEILASLSSPRIAARPYPVITVVTTTGAKLTGVRGRENEDMLQLYDISVPPVRRSVLKSDIAEVRVSKRGIFDHTRLGYTKQQRLDLAALLGTAQAK